MPTKRALTYLSVAEEWPTLSSAERARRLQRLPHEAGHEFFFDLGAADQAAVLLVLPPGERRHWIRLLAPDDVADLIQSAPDDQRAGLLALLDEPTRAEVAALLAYAEDEAGFLYSKVRSYASVSRAAIAEMHRQMGDELVYSKEGDEGGLLQRGLVIRLLVLPNDVGGVRDSLEWIKNELGPRVAVSLMAQYYPTNVAGTNQRYVLLSRRLNESEWLRAVAALDELGMQEGWMQEYDGAAFYYRPDFNDDDRPFRDIRDFESITS